MQALLLAAALTLPAAGTLDAAQLPDGGGTFTAGLQSIAGRGLVGRFQVGLNTGAIELGARLAAPLANPLGFFTADASVAFIGQTGAFLPVNVMPVMGFGAASYFMDVPKGTSTTTDINAYLYMPVGLRYALALGRFSVGAEALYHMPAVWLMKGTTDPARWHYGVTARTGMLMGEAYYETGSVYNGPGARVGLAF